VGVDGLVEVLVLLDELLDVVGCGVVGEVARGAGRQEGLASTHPTLGLLAVTQEQLQLQVLVQPHAPCYPRPAKIKPYNIFILFLKAKLHFLLFPTTSLFLKCYTCRC
jgi:hypothetical protein